MHSTLTTSNEMKLNKSGLSLNDRFAKKQFFNVNDRAVYITNLCSLFDDNDDKRQWWCLYFNFEHRTHMH